MKDFFFFTFFLSIACTINTGIFAEPTITNFEAANINELAGSIADETHDCKTTLVIFDCDGVLTNNSDPNNHPDNTEKRGNITELVKIFAHSSNSQVMISSAWSSFTDTLKRLKSLGLYETLNMTDEFFTNTIPVGAENFSGKALTKYQCGDVMSVKTESNRFYREKAYAGQLHSANTQYERIIFIDDSQKNTTKFAKDILTLPYANNAEVLIYHLGPPQPEELINADVLEDIQNNNMKYTEVRLSIQCDTLEAASLLEYIRIVNNETGQMYKPETTGVSERIPLTNDEGDSTTMVSGQTASFTMQYSIPGGESFSEEVVSREVTDGRIPVRYTQAKILAAIRFEAVYTPSRSTIPIRVSIAGRKSIPLGDKPASLLLEKFGVDLSIDSCFECDHDLMRQVLEEMPMSIIEDIQVNDKRYIELNSDSNQMADSMADAEVLENYIILRIGEYLKKATKRYHEKEFSSIDTKLLLAFIRAYGLGYSSDSEQIKEYFCLPESNQGSSSGA
jgi:hypothetical protein